MGSNKIEAIKNRGKNLHMSEIEKIPITTKNWGKI